MQEERRLPGHYSIDGIPGAFHRSAIKMKKYTKKVIGDDYFAAKSVKIVMYLHKPHAKGERNDHHTEYAGEIQTGAR